MAISSLKTQDGVHFLTAELNGDVIADRDLEAAWQEWDVLPDPFGDASVVVLKSAHGKYLSAYSPEYCAAVEPAAGHGQGDGRTSRRLGTLARGA